MVARGKDSPTEEKQAMDIRNSYLNKACTNRYEHRKLLSTLKTIGISSPAFVFHICLSKILTSCLFCVACPTKMDHKIVYRNINS